MEPLLTPPVLEDSVPLPAEWLVPTGLDQPVEPESEPAIAGDDGETVQPEPKDVAVVEPAAFEPVAFDEAAPEPAVASVTEPLPPLAEAFGPIPGLEPLPSFNVQAIFTMQSELAEKPLAPPIVPPLMAPPAELQLEAFPPVEAQSLSVSQTQLQEEAPTEAFAIPADPAPAEAAPEKPAGPRRNPFSRLRGLFKDCVEEVASTFGNEEEEESLMPQEPAAASAQTPRLSEYQAVPGAFTPPDPLVDSFPAQQPLPGARSLHLPSRCSSRLSPPGRPSGGAVTNPTAPQAAVLGRTGRRLHRPRPLPVIPPSTRCVPGCRTLLSRTTIVRPPEALTMVVDPRLLRGALQGRLIVSVQAPQGSPMRDPSVIAAMAEASLANGAVGVRLESPEHIGAVRQRCPGALIVGLWKRVYPDSSVYITPGWEEVRAVWAAGADIVAIDATARFRPGGEDLASLIERSQRDLGAPLMADADSLENGLSAAALRLSVGGNHLVRLHRIHS